MGRARWVEMGLGCALLLGAACVDSARSRTPLPEGDPELEGDSSGGDSLSGDPQTGDPASGDPQTPGPTWFHCPPSTDFVGAPSSFTLRVEPDAHYCNQPDEFGSVPQELQRKTMIRIVPGTYPLPNQDVTDAPFRLPVCALRAGVQKLVLGAVGTISGTITDAGGGAAYVQLNIHQSLQTSEGQVWDLWITIGTTREAGQTELVANGAIPPGTDDYGTIRTMTLCDAAECFGVPAPSDRLLLMACDFSTMPLHRHTIGFHNGAGTETGTVVLDLFMGARGMSASTEPCLFASAEGNIDGAVFSQTDFFALPYRPNHHHHQRNFGVVFDSPVAGLYGLVVKKVEYTSPGDVSPEIYADFEGDLEDDPGDPNDWATWVVDSEVVVRP